MRRRRGEVREVEQREGGGNRGRRKRVVRREASSRWCWVTQRWYHHSHIPWVFGHHHGGAWTHLPPSPDGRTFWMCMCVCLCLALCVCVCRDKGSCSGISLVTKQHVAVGYAQNAEWTCLIEEGGPHSGQHGMDVLLRFHCGSESPVSPSPPWLLMFVSSKRPIFAIFIALVFSCILFFSALIHLMPDVFRMCQRGLCWPLALIGQSLSLSFTICSVLCVCKPVLK